MNLLSHKRAVLSLLLLIACSRDAKNVPCTQDSDCDLGAGGKCTEGPTQSWCAYPDPNCPAGYRFSDQNIGDGVSDECVPPPDTPPDAAPECKQLIAYHRADGLYVVKPDGSGVETRATGNLEEYPVWSPDGRKLAFERGRIDNGSKDIWTINVDGTGLANLTAGAAGNDYQPAWSPNGTQIAFITRRGTTEDLWIMNADGSAPRMLDVKANAPAWSPDGKKIAYGSFKSGRFQVYVINPDGTGSKNLTMSNFGDSNPLWSPDGTKILFLGSRGGFGDAIYIMNADGTDQQALVASLLVNNDPVWSPDGRKIAFMGSPDVDQYDVYRVDADRTNLVNLTAGTTSDESEPTWSPDGTQLAIKSDRDGNHEIYRINADGTGPLRMTTSILSAEASPSWSPCK